MLAVQGKRNLCLFLLLAVLTTVAGLSPHSDRFPASGEGEGTDRISPARVDQHPTGDPIYITLFLCGDVMTGRGIDQVLPNPSDPRIYEPVVTDAGEYVRIAEQLNGPIPRPVEFPYIWGDALEELDRVQPDLRIINLETSVTKSDEFWPGKGINYRMHPENIPCLQAAKIDGCSLANNHTLDWGYAGLIETTATLKRSGIRFCGAGVDLEQARKTEVFEIEGGARVILFALCTVSSGVPTGWAATDQSPGVNLIRDFSPPTVAALVDELRAVKRPGDILVVSIHWGYNWGYEIPQAHRRFAHALIERAGVDLIHGHSSHHPRPIELYRGKLILYGCGDFINDYEGIGGYEEYRGDLALMFFPRIDCRSGDLVELQMTPLQIRRFRLQRASEADARWLRDTLDRYSRGFGARIELNQGRLWVR